MLKIPKELKKNLKRVKENGIEAFAEISAILSSSKTVQTAGKKALVALKEAQPFLPKFLGTQVGYLTEIFDTPAPTEKWATPPSNSQITKEDPQQSVLSDSEKEKIEQDDTKEKKASLVEPPEVSTPATKMDSGEKKRTSSKRVSAKASPSLQPAHEKTVSSPLIQNASTQVSQTLPKILSVKSEIKAPISKKKKRKSARRTSDPVDKKG